MLIGISLGVSESPCTIRPLAAALVFHQCFEGFALGGSLVDAGYKTCTFMHGTAHVLLQLRRDPQSAGSIATPVDT